MPNLNLLEGKDLQREVEKVDPTALSFESFQEAEPEPEPVEISQEQPPDTEIPETSVSKEYPSFGRRRSNWPFLVGSAAVVILIFALIYLLSRGKSKSTGSTEQMAVDSLRTEQGIVPSESTETAQLPAEIKKDEKKSAQPAEITRKPEGGEAARQIPAERTPVSPQPAPSSNLMADRQMAMVGAEALTTALNLLPGDVRISFFKFGDGQLAIEVASASRAAIADYFSALRRKLSAPGFKLLDPREGLVGSDVFVFQKILAELRPTGSSPTASASLPAATTRGELQRQAAASGLTVRELRLSGSGNIRWASLKADGSGSAVARFIEKLMNAYRNVGVNNLVLSTLSPQEILAGKSHAAIDLIIEQ